MDYKDKEKIKPILVDIFLNTEKLCKENGVLKSSIEKSRNATKIYHENFRTNKYDFGCDVKTKFIVNKHKSFEDAKVYIDEYGKADKIAVLNFANATHAGGAVRSGSRAQEESLCRCSTLYPCINTYSENNDYSNYINSNYYSYNYNLHRATSRVIYTPDVLVIKSDDDFPSLLEEKDWYKVDVLTCAANNQNKNKLSDDDLYNDMLAKAHNIYNVAIDNGVDVLILGAFGCGAFSCNPNIVAKAFYDAYRDYGYAFKEIRFAIYCNDKETENYNAFRRVFTERTDNYIGELKYKDLTKETLKLANENNLIAILTGGDMGDMGARYLVLDDGTILYANVYYGNEVTDDDLYEALGKQKWYIDIPKNGWPDSTCSVKGILHGEKWIMCYLGMGFFLHMKLNHSFYREVGKKLFVMEQKTNVRMENWDDLVEIVKKNPIIAKGSVSEIIGDALSNDADILLHQVNLHGVMGGGIAYHIAKKFPNVEKEYKEYANKKLGEVLFVETNSYVVGNCFSQTHNFDTDYDALQTCLDKVVIYMKDKHFKSIAIPYKYGCGIANGDWDTVYGIFKDKFKDFDLKVYKLDKDQKPVKKEETDYCLTKLIKMVAHLHDQGYQKLRMMIYYAPSGCYLRCELASKECFEKKTGFVILDYPDDEEIYRYSTGGEYYFFNDKTSMEGVSIEEMAKIFEKKYPKLMKKAKGEDESYANWFKQLLTYAKDDIYPYAFEDMGYDALCANALRLTDGNYIEFPSIEE